MKLNGAYLYYFYITSAFFKLNTMMDHTLPSERPTTENTSLVILMYNSDTFLLQSSAFQDHPRDYVSR